MDKERHRKIDNKHYLDLDFLRGVSQYGLLHFGHVLGLSSLFRAHRI